MSANLTLLSCTPNPEDLISMAIRQCYSPLEAGEIAEQIVNNKVSKQSTEKLINMIMKSGHTSTIEHVTFTFGLSNFSRISSQQLTRHRLANFSHQSQRYVSESRDWNYIIPPKISENEEAREVFTNALKDLKKACDVLTDLGIKDEDTRFIYPNALSTSLIFTMNARELIHFLTLRLCKRSQWEIRDVAYQMLVILRKRLPIIFNHVDKPCVFGKCKENNPCNES